MVLAAVSGLMTGCWAMGAFDWTRRKPTVADYRAYRAHLVTVGATRSGKTTARKKDCFELLGKEAQLIIDPLGQFADELYEYAALKGMADWIVMDDLSRRDRVLMYEVIECSDAADPIDRIQENKIRLEEYLERFAQTRGMVNFSETKPGLHAWLSAAGALVQNQREPVPQDLILDAMRIGSAGYRRLIAGCTDARTVEKFTALEGYTPKYVNDLLQWPQQVLDAVLCSVTVLARISARATDFAELYRQKRTVIIRSDYRVPKESAIFLGLCAQLGAFRIAARHKADTKTPLPITITVDECNGFPWVSPAVCNYIVQSAQWGIRYRPIFQFLDTKQEKVNETLLSNFDIDGFQQKSPDSAHLLARSLATLLLNAQATKDVQKRERTMTTGHERERITTTSKQKNAYGKEGGKTESEHLINTPIIHTVTDEQKVFLPLSEQIQLYEKALMTLSVGERLTKRGTAVSDPAAPEKVIPLEAAQWDSLASSRASTALDQMRARAPFVTPDLSRLIAPPLAESPSAAEILGAKGTRRKGRRSGS